MLGNNTNIQVFVTALLDLCMQSHQCYLHFHHNATINNANQDTIFTWIFPWNARCLEYLGDCGEKSEDICLTRIPAALRWPQLSLNRISPGHLINDFNTIATTGYYDRKNCLNCSLSFVINNAGIISGLIYGKQFVPTTKTDVMSVNYDF